MYRAIPVITSREGEELKIIKIVAGWGVWGVSFIGELASVNHYGGGGQDAIHSIVRGMKTKQIIIV